MMAMRTVRSRKRSPNFWTSTATRTTGEPPNIEYHIGGDLANVVVAPVGGFLVHVTISRPDKNEEEVVRIHPDECFYAEDYVMCDTHTRLAHAVLDVVNKVYGKEGE